MSDDMSVVLALKDLRVAKSRLGALPLMPDAREALVATMLADTIGAVQDAGAARILVVSPDGRVHDHARRLGVEPIAEPPGTRGLNGALTLGASAAGRSHRIVYLQADLPALRAGSFMEALAAADGLPAAFVADRHGTGTTLLTVAPGYDFAPAFGPESAAAHRGAGAAELDPRRRRWADLRCDVDTPEDVRAAIALNPGSRTAAAAREVGRQELRR